MTNDTDENGNPKKADTPNLPKHIQDNIAKMQAELAEKEKAREREALSKFGARALRELRKSAGFTLEALAEKSGVSLSTIKRIEAGATGNPNAHSLKQLEKALGIEKGTLSTRSAEMLKREREKLRGMVRREFSVDTVTNVNLEMVCEAYHLDGRTFMDLAPLCVAIIAEMSLKWRREQLELAEAAMDILRDSPTVSVSINEMYNAESVEAIDDKMIFGDPHTPYHDKYPLAAFLREFASDLASEIIQFDPDMDLVGEASTFRRHIPDYAIARDLFEDITGGSEDAKDALARGFASLLDKPRDKARADIPAWLASKSPKDGSEKYDGRREKDIHGRARAKQKEIRRSNLQVIDGDADVSPAGQGED